MLICIQNFNFITHFYLKILQRNSKLVLLSILGMPGHSINLKKSLMFIYRQKSTLSFTFALTYCKDIANLLLWVLWACLATHTQSDNINLWKTFVLICRQNINFNLQSYANLFQVLWQCLTNHTQNGSIIMQKTSMVICMAKINFIIHFFFQILHFKESCNLIG